MTLALFDTLEVYIRRMLGSSLNLKFPVGRTLLLSTFFLFLLLLLGEMVTRSMWFQSKMPVGEWGTDFRHVATKLDQLKSFTSQKGSLDCLFLGNSMVLNGVDPESFSQAYQEQTGQAIDCFNFGIDGMPAAGAGAFVDVLVDDFQPRLLFYFGDAVDFTIGPDAWYSTIFTEMPWLRHRRGEFDLKGNLVENSALYRSRRALFHILQLDFRSAFVDWDEWDDAGQGNRNGYMPYENEAFDVTVPPDLEIMRQLEGFHYALLNNYTIYPENVRGLERIINQTNKDTQVIVVQMPVPDIYMTFFGDGENDYQRFIELVEDSTESGQVRFVKTIPTLSFADDDWYDYGHLDAAGAEIFSRWLGGYFGRLVVEGEVSLTTTATE